MRAELVEAEHRARRQAQATFDRLRAYGQEHDVRVTVPGRTDASDRQLAEAASAAPSSWPAVCGSASAGPGATFRSWPSAPDMDWAASWAVAPYPTATEHNASSVTPSWRTASAFTRSSATACSLSVASWRSAHWCLSSVAPGHPEPPQTVPPDRNFRPVRSFRPQLRALQIEFPTGAEFRP